MVEEIVNHNNHWGHKMTFLESFILFLENIHSNIPEDFNESFTNQLQKSQANDILIHDLLVQKEADFSSRMLDFPEIQTSKIVEVRSKRALDKTFIKSGNLNDFQNHHRNEDNKAPMDRYEDNSHYENVPADQYHEKHNLNHNEQPIIHWNYSEDHEDKKQVDQDHSIKIVDWKGESVDNENNIVREEETIVNSARDNEARHLNHEKKISNHKSDAANHKEHPVGQSDHETSLDVKQDLTYQVNEFTKHDDMPKNEEQEEILKYSALKNNDTVVHQELNEILDDLTLKHNETSVNQEQEKIIKKYAHKDDEDVLPQNKNESFGDNIEDESSYIDHNVMDQDNENTKNPNYEAESSYNMKEDLYAKNEPVIDDKIQDVEVNNDEEKHAIDFSEWVVHLEQPACNKIETLDNENGTIENDEAKSAGNFKESLYHKNELVYNDKEQVKNDKENELVINVERHASEDDNESVDDEDNPRDQNVVETTSRSYFEEEIYCATDAISRKQQQGNWDYIEKFVKSEDGHDDNKESEYDDKNPRDENVQESSMSHGEDNIYPTIDPINKEQQQENLGHKNEQMDPAEECMYHNESMDLGDQDNEEYSRQQLKRDQQVKRDHEGKLVESKDGHSHDNITESLYDDENQKHQNVQEKFMSQCEENNYSANDSTNNEQQEQEDYGHENELMKPDELCGFHNELVDLGDQDTEEYPIAGVLPSGVNARNIYQHQAGDENGTLDGPLNVSSNTNCYKEDSSMLPSPMERSTTVTSEIYDINNSTVDQVRKRIVCVSSSEISSETSVFRTSLNRTAVRLSSNCLPILLCKFFYDLFCRFLSY